VGLLDKMCKQLRNEVVIALDIEGHTEHSCLGMTCTIQIATYECVYIVDCIKLYHLITHKLGPIFSNKYILKTVLDAEDLLEFQRDFLVYFQSVIDVQEVYHFLNPSVFQVSFKTLVSEYFGVTVDKVQQKADWRVRPLHDDLLAYA
jgi:ribonuclease D